MATNATRKISEARFWRDACIAGGQVTFGVVAILWFVPPFDAQKISVLAVNTIATMVFVYYGLVTARRV